MTIKSLVKLFFLILTVSFSAKSCIAADHSENNVPSLELLCMHTLLKNREHYNPEYVSPDLHLKMVRLALIPHLERLHTTCIALEEEYQKNIDEAWELGRVMGTQHKQAAYMSRDKKEYEIEQFKLKCGYNLTGFNPGHQNADPKAYALSLTDRQIKKASQKRRQRRKALRN
ncbi:MAG: hypothetical protein WD055_04980 [Candidatus Dependentiae bacterium]